MWLGEPVGDSVQMRWVPPQRPLKGNFWTDALMCVGREEPLMRSAVIKPTTFGGVWPPFVSAPLRPGTVVISVLIRGRNALKSCAMLVFC